MTDEEARRISDYLFVPDDIFEADVALVFGMSLWHRPLEKSIELHAAGVVRKLLFTGGYNAKIEAREAEAMARGAADRGVPAADVLVEPCSSNTRENVERSLDLLASREGLGSLTGVLLVAIGFHMRRALLTARRVFPAHVRIGTCSYDSIHYTKDSWPGSEIGRRDVISEIEKIRRYLGEGPELP
jgi:uncharacterized SAM-binding protein YcdF (DUF218 family)